jgi:ATP-dependent DNA helicase RecG
MLAKLNLSSKVSQLDNIGTVYSRRLSSLGIETIEDLIYYFPFRYDNLSNVKLISELEIDEVATVKATLLKITKLRTKSGKVLIKATVSDPSGNLEIVWFNQAYLLTVLKINQVINFSGKVGAFGNKKSLINPSYEIIKNNSPIHTERLVPIYSEHLGISAKWLRTKLHQLLTSNILEINDFLSDTFLASEKLINLKTALREIHFPTSEMLEEKARERLAFDQLLLLHLRNLKQKKLYESKKTKIKFSFNQKHFDEMKKRLPFKLTVSQKKAIAETTEDLRKDTPMNRLLQGEVGSGKTVVSCFPILACIQSGYQAALLAPTEILAKQHYQTISNFLGIKAKIKLYTGSSKDLNEDFDVVIGTHAILNKSFKFKNLGLIVVDEQQRFGVVQRSILKNRPELPHFLTMTATPIPRTLALTVYGNLEISVIDEIPTGRQLVKTYLVPASKRNGAYDFIRKEITSGGQVFIICPLIEESETLTSVKSAKAEFERLQKEIFKGLNLGLLHGKLKAKEKDEVIAKFKTGETQILVSTPVVEVGIDIPNAAIMVIEDAERFGLASLHQLRGRVGRGVRQSYCLLFTKNTSPKVTARLKLMEKYTNGLKLAEMDLELRGPGDIYGTLQHGDLDLSLANNANLDLIVRSKKAAETLFSKTLDPQLKERLSRLETSEVTRD